MNPNLNPTPPLKTPSTESDSLRPRFEKNAADRVYQAATLAAAALLLMTVAAF